MAAWDWLETRTACSAYDMVHSRYHVMWQWAIEPVYVARWSYAVSSDRVTFEVLPIALQNNGPCASFPGSGGLLSDVERTPVLSYSHSDHASIGLAFPANRGDRPDTP